MYQTSSKELFQKYPNPVFIESGSYYGDGVQAAVDAGFKIIYSIELDAKLYMHCVNRFKDNPGVNIIFGDSHLLLDYILSRVNTPATFWLDGHWAGEGTARGEFESPLIKELEAIGRHYIKNHKILIDDLRCWNCGVQGFDKETITEVCLQINPEYKITFENGYAENDILVATI
jgi:hypothetical protein